jgi:hypothetical protein
MKNQPERRIASIDTTNDGSTMDIITTSQKLAHRLAHEVKKTPARPCDLCLERRRHSFRHVGCWEIRT